MEIYDLMMRLACILIPIILFFPGINTALAQDSTACAERFVTFPEVLFDGSDTDSIKVVKILRYIYVNVYYDRKIAYRFLEGEEAARYAFCHEVSACEGFADLFHYWLNKIGITSEIVYGKPNLPHYRRAKKQNKHAWVVLKLNGRCWTIDPTFISHSSFNPDIFNHSQALFIPPDYAQYSWSPDDSSFCASLPIMRKDTFAQLPYYYFLFWGLQPKIVPKLVQKGDSLFCHLPNLGDSLSYRFSKDELEGGYLRLHIKQFKLPIISRSPSTIVFKVEQQTSFKKLNVHLFHKKDKYFIPTGGRIIEFAIPKE